MLAMAVNESNFRPSAINVARPGVFDLGLMQVRCVTLGAVAEVNGTSSSVASQVGSAPRLLGSALTRTSANSDLTSTPRDRCTNGPARGLYAYQLLNPDTNIRTAWAVYEMHGRDPGRYNGATGMRAKKYRQRIAALEAALMGLPFVAPDKRTRGLCRRIVEAMGKEPRS